MFVALKNAKEKDIKTTIENGQVILYLKKLAKFVVRALKPMYIDRKFAQTLADLYIIVKEDLLFLIE